ncbi:MAG: rod shape-determining protein, partial [Chloroflexi bacterium]|nr:rod shape-determining protein [Chloroflexota bacterium]
MAGGSSLLRNIDRFITQRTGVPAHVAEDPIICTALGAGRGLEHLPLLRRSLESI